MEERPAHHAWPRPGGLAAIDRHINALAGGDAENVRSLHRIGVTRRERDRRNSVGVSKRLQKLKNGTRRFSARLGMRQEAYFVQNEIFKGEWGDEVVFAILAHEWADRQGSARSNQSTSQ